MSIVQLCLKAKNLSSSYRLLASVFSRSLINLLSAFVLQMILGIYFCITFIAIVPADSAKWYISASVFALLFMIGFLRLLYLTDAVHSLHRELNTLIEVVEEVEDEGGGAAVRARRALLSLGDGMPAREFLVVKRSLVPSMAGHLFTMIVVMIQFRENGTTKDQLCHCANMTSNISFGFQTMQ